MNIMPSTLSSAPLFRPRLDTEACHRARSEVIENRLCLHRLIIRFFMGRGASYHERK